MEIEMESRVSRLCFSAANQSLHLAYNTNGSGLETHHSVCGIVFVAFAFEAMMNHYGRAVIPDWNSEERKGSRQENHRRILATLGVPDLVDSAQYHTLWDCNRLRDKIAHGKTTDDTVQSTIDPGTLDREHLVRAVLSEPSTLERQFVPERLEAFIDALSELENLIERGSDIGEFPLSNSGIVSW